MARLAPWQEHIDNMRRTLFKIEMEMMDTKEPPDAMKLSVYLTSLDNSAQYLAAGICDELGEGLRTALDISGLSPHEGDGICHQL